MARYVTEADLEPILPPEGSFLADYLIYAISRGDSALSWHMINALGLISAVVPKDLTVEGLHGGTIYANWWGIAVGPPAGHKTSALNYAMKLLYKLAPTRVATAKGSAEAIARSLQTPPGPRLMPLTEMGDFLSNTGSMQYAQQIKPMLTDLFDCQPYVRAVGKANVNIREPRVSVLAAVNESMLTTFTSPNDWGGGFMSRWMVMQSEPERGDPVDAPTQETEDAAYAGLERLSTDKLGPCLGLDPSAWQRWTSWQVELKAKHKGFQSDIHHGIIGRTPLYAMKTALLMSYDFGPGRDAGGGPWSIPAWILEMGIRFAELGCESVLELAEDATPDDDMRRRGLILNILRAQHEMWQRGETDSPFMPLWALLRQAKMLKRQLMEIVETLLAERRCAYTTMGADWLLRYVPDEQFDETPGIEEANALVKALKVTDRLQVSDILDDDLAS